MKNEFKNAYRQARINFAAESHLEVPLIDEAVKCFIARQTRKSDLHTRLLNYKAKSVGCWSL